MLYLTQISSLKRRILCDSAQYPAILHSYCINIHVILQVVYLTTVLSPLGKIRGANLLSLQLIQWTGDVGIAFTSHMSIDHCRIDIFMAHEFLDRSNREYTLLSRDSTLSWFNNTGMGDSKN